MCEMCKMAGLDHECQTCGGFDWVDDVYEDERSPVKFRARLCVDCRSAWDVIMKRQGV